MDSVSKYIKENRTDANWLSKMMKMKDGFTMSVQASEGHYCSPRDDTGPWYRFEVGFPSNRDNLLTPYVQRMAFSTLTKSIYPWVPLEVVEAVIKKHGGIV